MSHFFHISRLLLLGLVFASILSTGCAPDDKPLTNKNRPAGPLEVRSVEEDDYLAYVAGRIFEAKKLVHVAMNMRAMSEREGRTKTETVFKCPEMLSYGPTREMAYELVLKSDPCRPQHNEQLVLNFEGTEWFRVSSFRSLKGVRGVEEGREAPESMTYKTIAYRVQLKPRGQADDVKEGVADILEEREFTMTLEEDSELEEGLAVYSFNYTVNSDVKQFLKQGDLRAEEHSDEKFQLSGTLLYDFRNDQVALHEPKVTFEADIPRWVSKDYGSREKKRTSVEISLHALPLQKNSGQVARVLFDEESCGLPVARLEIEKFAMDTARGRSTYNGTFIVLRDVVGYDLSNPNKKVKRSWVQCKSSTNHAARNWIPYDAIYLK